MLKLPVVSTNPTNQLSLAPHFAITLRCRNLAYVLPRLSPFHCGTSTVVPQSHKLERKWFQSKCVWRQECMLNLPVFSSRHAILHLLLTPKFLFSCGYRACVFPRMFPFHHSTSTVVLQCHKGREVISKCLCLSSPHRVLWMHTNAY